MDTGATYCAIATDEARLIGYRAADAGKVGIHTGGGSRSAEMVRFREVSLLGIHHRRVAALVLPFPSDAVRAIVGWTFLRGHAFEFDGKTGRFRIRG